MIPVNLGGPWPWASDGASYAIRAETFSGSFNPADSTTYYFGSLATTAPSTTAGSTRRIGIPVSGVITAVSIVFAIGGTLGSAQTFTCFIRKNNTTNGTITSVATADAASTSFLGNPSLSVTAGDYIEIGITTPVWVTNPTNMGISAEIFIQG